MDNRSDSRQLLSMMCRPSADVLISRLGDETVMLDLATERYFGLDAAGTVFWDELTTSPTIALAVEKLLERFDVDRETLTEDASMLIAHLNEKGLITTSNAASP